MDTGDRYEHTFSAPGDYPYFCTLHPFMTGIIHVHGKADNGVSAPR
jgi:plastocyanin